MKTIAAATLRLRRNAIGKDAQEDLDYFCNPFGGPALNVTLISDTPM